MSGKLERVPAGRRIVTRVGAPQALASRRRGRRGPRGARGPTGPAGPAGPGSTFTHRVSGEGNLGPGSTSSVVIRCPDAGTAIAGGFSSSSTLVFMNESSVGTQENFSDTNAWNIQVTNTGGSAATWRGVVTCVN